MALVILQAVKCTHSTPHREPKLTRNVLQVLLQEPDKRRDTPLHAAACNGFTHCADVRSGTRVFQQHPHALPLILLQYE